MLLSQIMAIKPMLRTLLEQPEDDDDDEEHFVDAPDSDDESATGDATKAAASPAREGAQGGQGTSAYDPLKREPMYAGAERSSFWELMQVRAGQGPGRVDAAERTCAQERKRLSTLLRSKLAERLQAIQHANATPPPTLLSEHAPLSSVHCRIFATSAGGQSRLIQRRPPARLCSHAVRCGQSLACGVPS